MVKENQRGFLQFDFFAGTIRHHNSFDPSTMAIEDSSLLASEDSSNTSPSPQLIESVNDTEQSLDDEFQATMGMKEKPTNKSAGKGKGKKRCDDQQTEWHTSFLHLMEHNLEQEESEQSNKCNPNRV